MKSEHEIDRSSFLLIAEYLLIAELYKSRILILFDIIFKFLELICELKVRFCNYHDVNLLTSKRFKLTTNKINMTLRSVSVEEA